MANSVLSSFVSGTRQVLTIQLIVSVCAVGLAGWTLGVTNELIRERDRLRERVIQLEQTMGGSGIVVPNTPTVVETTPPPAETAYPGEIGDAPDTASTPEAVDQAAADGETPTEAPTREPSPEPPAATGQRDLGSLLASLFSPPPPLRTLVLHVRSQNDAPAAQRVAEAMQRSDLRVVIDVMTPRDPRESGYAYFDGRQSRAAAALVTQFHDIARQQEIAAWSAQLRGTALPAQGEYTVDRLDLVLPPLPQRPSFELQRVDPSLLRRQVQPQPAPQRIN